MFRKKLGRIVVIGSLCLAGAVFVMPMSTSAVGAAEQHPTTLPTQADLRPRLQELGLKPRRQGARGTCSVFTTAAAMEFALSNHANQTVVLSPEYLNWAADKVMNYPQGDGHYFHDLIHGYEQYGVCPEEDMPYTAKFDSSRQPSAEALKDAKKTLATSGLEVHWIKKLQPDHGPGLSPEQMRQVKEIIASGYPVASGASHSRLLVGYVDDASLPGGGFFRSKDSALGRYSTVTYEFVATKINDAYWVSTPAAASASAAAAAN